MFSLLETLRLALNQTSPKVSHAQLPKQRAKPKYWCHINLNWIRETNFEMRGNARYFMVYRACFNLAEMISCHKGEYNVKILQNREVWFLFVQVSALLFLLSV